MTTGTEPTLTEKRAYLTKEGVQVKVGQIWRDLDSRMNGRMREITGIDEHGAKAVMAYPGTKKGKTLVSIKRMHRHSTGWELFKDV